MGDLALYVPPAGFRLQQRVEEERSGVNQLG